MHGCAHSNSYTITHELVLAGKVTPSPLPFVQEARSEHAPIIFPVAEIYAKQVVELPEPVSLHPGVQAYSDDELQWEVRSSG